MRSKRRKKRMKQLNESKGSEAKNKDLRRESDLRDVSDYMSRKSNSMKYAWKALKTFQGVENLNQV